MCKQWLVTDTPMLKSRATEKGRMATSTQRRRPSNKKEAQNSGTIALPLLADEHLDISALETWLWDAACAIRGATDAPKFKDFILPLIFYKRLSDVFDDEFAGQVKEFGDEDIAREVIKASDFGKLHFVPIHVWDWSNLHEV